MGCFLGCFGASKDQKRRQQRNKVLPRDHRHGGQNPVLLGLAAAPAATLEQEQNKHIPISPAPQLLQCRDNSEEKLSFSSRKKVTFDANVKTYEHVSGSSGVEDCTSDDDAEKARQNVEQKKSVESFAKSSHSHSTASEDGSTISSLGSYPCNYRYQNCRDSDDEAEEGSEDELSDLDEDEEQDDYNCYEDEPSEESVNAISKKNREMEEDEAHSPIPINGTNRSVRYRSAYVHSVLNPVENISQWKAVKARGKGANPPPLKYQKENFILNQEPRISFSLEPTFQDSSFSFKGKSDRSKREEGIAVDASLSNWLETSKCIPNGKKEDDPFEFEKSRPSNSSNSAISFDDRPILGVLTVEDLQQFSASASPRKSPSRSPDEMPIIGSVGSYWQHSDEADDSGSISSFKGIPNTTSKYREDKRVNWHSTPFETRLERALNRGDAACS